MVMQIRQFLHAVVACILTLPGFLSPSLLYSQNVESVFSQGYSTDVQQIARLANGTWVLGVLDVPASVIGFEDIPFLRFYDSIGVFTYEILLLEEPVYEKYSITGLAASPSGGWVVEYGGSDCDISGNYRDFIELFDSNGQILWRDSIDNPGLDPRFYFTDDGKLITLRVQYFESDIGVEVRDLVTGQIEELLTFEHPSTTLFELVPGTKNIIVADREGLYYYTYFTHGSDSWYQQTASNVLDIGNGGLSKLRQDYSGWYFTFRTDTKAILRFDTNLEYTSLPVGADIKDFTPVGDNIAVLETTNDARYSVTILDSLGHPLRSVSSDMSGIRPDLIVGEGQYIGLAGTYGSGTENAAYHDAPYAGRKQAWFRLMHTSDTTDNPVQTSASVTGIIRNTEIERDSFWSEGPILTGYLHNFEGGDFMVEITNNGTLPLESLWMNTRFQLAINFYFCAPIVSETRLFDGLNIQPGESTWINFGDISAFNQKEFPQEICFWTSGPNGNPDYKPEDDFWCTEKVVGVKEHELPALQVYPIPATEWVTIELPDQIPVPEKLEIYDLSGFPLMTEKIPSGSKSLKVDMSYLHSGMYLLRLGNYSEKILVAR